MYILHDMFPNFLIWAKKAMKIVIYQKTKMLLFCYHTKCHQYCSIVSMEIWGVCLQDFSHFLQIVWRSSVKMVCLTFFDPVSQRFFHVSAVFSFYKNRVINLLPEPLDRLLCEYATRMIWVRVPIFPFSTVVSTLSETLDFSTIIGEI